MNNLKQSNEYRKVTVASIVFLQGDDYSQYEQEKEQAEKWNDIDYLLQWYDGDDSHLEQSNYDAYNLNTAFLGKLIKIIGYKGYFLFSKDTRIGYIGLARLIEIL